MISTLWLKGLLARRSGRLIGAMLGVGLTIAMIATIGTFTVASGVTMTQRAITDVPVDWQVQLTPGTDPKTVTQALGQASPYQSLLPVGYADSSGFSARTTGSTQTTGAGKVLGINAQYRQTFPAELRLLIGSLEGTLIAQQTAANLQVTVGDTVTIQRPGLKPVATQIAGVVDLPYADSLFQAVGAPPGASPQAPPDNVLILPLAQWHQWFDPQAQIRPDAVRLQLHVRLEHTPLPQNPNQAYSQVQAQARNLEARIAGSGLVGNNLGARLDGARQDALYARVLFLFLGLPGVCLAILLTLAVTATGSDRRQQEQALLRTRGANTPQILQLASLEGLLLGLGGSLLGLIGTVLASLTVVSPGQLLRPGTLAWIAGSMLGGLLLALVAVLYPAWKNARSTTVTSAKSLVGGSLSGSANGSLSGSLAARQRSPLWQRIYLDAFLLTLSGLLFWQLASTGYQVVLAPEGVPQTSVSYESFVPPLFLWLGIALLTLRATQVGLHQGRGALAKAASPILGPLSGVVTAALSRQRRLVSFGVGLVAIAFSFAISTAIFNTTYNAQSRVDAELTNGADVQVALHPGSGGVPVALQNQLKALPNVVALQPMQHRFAYVGTDLQDLYGIDPKTLLNATQLSNAYFASHNAQATLSALAARPDGVLVSAETVKDFQLKLGDQVNLRLQNAASGQYQVIPFHFVDIVKEFPTAPKDSFLVANASYVAQQTQSPAAEIVLIRTSANPAQVAAVVTPLVSALPGAKVTDIKAAQATIRSSLTAVDLHGLTQIESVFAVLLLVGATGLVLALGMVERRRIFAILVALGAKPRQLGAFLWTEGLLVLIGGAVVGGLLGFGVAQMLVKILTGVFDPPPENLVVPWPYLLGLSLVAAVSTAAAVLWIQRSSQSAGVEMLRDI